MHNGLILSSYQTAFTIPQSYLHTIVNTFFGVSMDTWTENSQVKVRKLS